MRYCRELAFSIIVVRAMSNLKGKDVADVCSSHWQRRDGPRAPHDLFKLQMICLDSNLKSAPRSNELFIFYQLRPLQVRT